MSYDCNFSEKKELKINQFILARILVAHFYLSAGRRAGRQDLAALCACSRL